MTSEGFRRQGDTLEWACPSCGQFNDIDELHCSACGTAFTERFRPAEEPEPPRNWTAALAVSAIAPGAGHMSVVLRLRDREALLCGDAAYTLDAIENDTVPYIVQDEHRYRRSLREIQLYLEQTPGALVVPGHELAVMRRLDRAY